jgi:hypothetical protein
MGQIGVQALVPLLAVSDEPAHAAGMKIRNDIEVGALRQVAVGGQNGGRKQRELYQEAYNSALQVSGSHLCFQTLIVGMTSAFAVK